LVGAQWFTQKITVLNQLIENLPKAIRGLPGAENGIQPNELAGALIWVLPAAGLALVAFFKDKAWFIGSAASKVRWLRAFGWAVFLAGTMFFTVLGWVLAQSRGAYLAIILAALGASLAVLPRRLRLPGIALVLVIGLTGLWFFYQVGWETVSTNISDTLSVNNGAFSLDTLSSRAEIWSRGVWALRDAPLTGLGMNSFRNVVHLIYPMLSVPASFNLGHAHNEFLQVGLDLGLPGLVAFLALNILAFVMIYRAFQAGGAERWLALGLGGGLLAHLIYGMTDAVALGAKPGFLFWWLLALIYGLYRQTQMPSHATERATL
jgi:putative inorganic carbon (hco3(-)) transporter